MPNVQWRCAACTRLSSRWGTQCKRCSAVYSLQREELHSVYEGVTTLSEEIEARERIKTGLAPFDRLIRGIPRGKIVVVFGKPDAGKSTIGLQCASCCPGSSLYVAAEWGVRDAMERAIELELPRDASHHFVERTDTDAVCELIRTSSPDLAVIDSWQALWCEEGGSSPAKQLLYALVSLEAAAQDHTAVLLISKARKDGEFAGSQRTLHAVSGASLRLRKTRPFRRELRVEKTRICKEGSVRLVMDEHGLRAVRLKGDSTAPTKLAVVSSLSEAR